MITVVTAERPDVIANAVEDRAEDHPLEVGEIDRRNGESREKERAGLARSETGSFVLNRGDRI
ncbi:hypothetical protein [Lentzea sp.]|uniref:hypothetical protein n=1 Tax=Lentzea sp. TaxID=56099 RepID=UPI002ED1944C